MEINEFKLTGFSEGTMKTGTQADYIDIILSNFKLFKGVRQRCQHAIAFYNDVKRGIAIMYGLKENNPYEFELFNTWIDATTERKNAIAWLAETAMMEAPLAPNLTMAIIVSETSKLRQTGYEPGCGKQSKRSELTADRLKSLECIARLRHTVSNFDSYSNKVDFIKNIVAEMKMWMKTGNKNIDVLEKLEFIEVSRDADGKMTQIHFCDFNITLRRKGNVRTDSAPEEAIDGKRTNRDRG